MNTSEAQNDGLHIKMLLEKPTLSVEEAGKVMGIGRQCAYEAIRRGDLPSIRLGRRILVPTAKLKTLMGLD